MTGGMYFMYKYPQLYNYWGLLYISVPARLILVLVESREFFQKLKTTLKNQQYIQMYAHKSYRYVNNNHVDNMIMTDGYHYIVMFWWWIGYKLMNDRNDCRLHKYIYTSLSVTSTGIWDLARAHLNWRRVEIRNIRNLIVHYVL